MKRILSIIVLSSLVIMMSVGMAAAREKHVITESFEAKKSIKIQTAIGNCRVAKSDDGKIHVEVIYTVDPDSFEPEFRDKGSRLIIREDIDGDTNGGKIFWVIHIPKETRVQFKSGTGDFKMEGIGADIDVSTGTGEIEIIDCRGDLEASTGTGNILIIGCEGEIDVSTGTGRVEIEKSKGYFDASSGTGDVEARGIVIEEQGDFSSGTGDAEVKLPDGSGYDLEISSGTGDAILVCEKDKIEGYFQFTAQKTGRRIRSPIEFDGEEEFYRDDKKYVRKYFTRGNEKNRYYISTGTGRAKLKM